jgi:hypothetical protein
VTSLSPARRSVARGGSYPAFEIDGIKPKQRKFLHEA